MLKKLRYILQTGSSLINSTSYSLILLIAVLNLKMGNNRFQNTCISHKTVNPSYHLMLHMIKDTPIIQDILQQTSGLTNLMSVNSNPLMHAVEIPLFPCILLKVLFLHLCLLSYIILLLCFPPALFPSHLLHHNPALQSHFRSTVSKGGQPRSAKQESSGCSTRKLAWNKSSSLLWERSSLTF